MVFVIKSAVTNQDRRNVIRSTWGGVKVFDDVMFEIIFVLGTSTDAEITKKVKAESQLYGDILQCDLKDYARYDCLQILMWLFLWAVAGFCREPQNYATLTYW